jgi:hypothetical protein
MTKPNEEGQSPTQDETGSESEQDRRASPISTRIGRNKVEIDVSALKHLVDTVNAKLKP